VLCPGFVRNAVVVDPIFVPVTLGLPAMLCVLQLLKAPKITLGVGLPLVAVGAMYTALNWTTAFPIAITVVYLSVSMPSQWKRWLLVFSIIGACAVGVTLTSISEKISSGDAVPLSSRLQTLYNAYLFGAGGYGGYPMNWPKATVRLISANVIGLLPLWAVYVWRIHESCRKGAALNWRAFLPLITAVLVIAGFRNAFAHHPWTAASILIYGAVFSMALLGGVNVPRDSAELPAGAIRGPLLRRLGFLTVCLMYACVVVWVLRVNSTDMDALVALIRQNTNRPDVIVVDRTLDPWLAQKAELGLSTMLDRRIAVTKERTAPIVQRGSAEKPRFLLTATNKEDNGTLVAHTIRPKSLAHRIVEGSLNWYRRAIARRDKRDRFETEAVYYLYKFP
jgi:hypothetical protein